MIETDTLEIRAIEEIANKKKNFKMKEFLVNFAVYYSQLIYY